MQREGWLAKAKIKRLYLIPILSKALDVIELLEQDNAPLTLEDVYQRTNISKTSVYRILKTLVHRGYLAQTPSGQYRLVSRPRRLALRICGAERGDAVQRSGGAERDGGGGCIGRGVDHSGQPLRSATWPCATRRSLSPSAWTWCWSSRWKKLQRRAWRTSSRKLRFPWWPSTCPIRMRRISAWTTSRLGYEAASILAQYAQRKWKSKVDRVVGVGFREAGSFVQNRIAGAFDGIRERFKELTPDQFVQIEGRGMREASHKAMSEYIARTASGRIYSGGRRDRFKRAGRSGRGARSRARGELRHRGPGLHSRGDGGDAHGIERDCRIHFA